jgi:hypothetical protein
MNAIVKPITPDGRTGFDEYGQLFTWSVPDADGYKTGHIIRDVRAMKCYICDRGWGNTTEELQDQTSYDKFPVHKNCYAGMRKVQDRDTISAAFIDAGFMFKMTDLDPRYPDPGTPPARQISILHADDDRTPSKYNIIIARRRRVWNIQMHGAGDMTKIFQDVTDTKGYTGEDYQGYEETDRHLGAHFYVHCWDKKQMVDYLTRFRHHIIDTDPTANINRGGV